MSDIVERLRQAQGWFDSDDQITFVVRDAATEIDALKARIDGLEKLRPVWAQGHSNDSVAAQVSAAALAELWSLLGGSGHQTEAVTALRQLLAERDAFRAKLMDADADRLRLIEDKAALHAMVAELVAVYWGDGDGDPKNPPDIIKRAKRLLKDALR